MVAASDAHHKTRKREEKKRQTEDAATDGRTNERTNECWRGESASCCCSFLFVISRKERSVMSVFSFCVGPCVTVSVQLQLPAVAMHNSHPNCKLWLLVFSVFFFSFLFAVVVVAPCVMCAHPLPSSSTPCPSPPSCVFKGVWRAREWGRRAGTTCRRVVSCRVETGKRQGSKASALK